MRKMTKDQPEKKSVRAIKGILWWLGGEFICLIFHFCMLLMMKKFMAVKIIAAVSSLIITNGLFFNYTYNCAVRDRNLIRYHGLEYTKGNSVFIALTAPLPMYVTWAALLLSKLGIIKDFFSMYILTNIQCIGWVDLFTAGREITDLSWAGLFGLLVLVLAAPAVIIVTYEMVIRDKDVKAMVLYGKRGG